MAFLNGLASGLEWYFNMAQQERMNKLREKQDARLEEAHELNMEKGQEWRDTKSLRIGEQVQQQQLRDANIDLAKQRLKFGQTAEDRAAEAHESGLKREALLNKQTEQAIGISGRADKRAEQMHKLNIEGKGIANEQGKLNLEKTTLFMGLDAEAKEIANETNELNLNKAKAEQAQEQQQEAAQDKAKMSQVVSYMAEDLGANLYNLDEPTLTQSDIDEQISTMSEAMDMIEAMSLGAEGFYSYFDGLSPEEQTNGRLAVAFAANTVGRHILKMRPEPFKHGSVKDFMLRPSAEGTGNFALDVTYHDPKTGKLKQGPLTEGGTQDPNDPVGVFNLQEIEAEMGKWFKSARTMQALHILDDGITERQETMRAEQAKQTQKTDEARTEAAASLGAEATKHLKTQLGTGQDNIDNPEVREFMKYVEQDRVQKAYYEQGGDPQNVTSYIDFSRRMFEQEAPPEDESGWADWFKSFFSSGRDEPAGVERMFGRSNQQLASPSQQPINTGIEAGGDDLQSLLNTDDIIKANAEAKRYEKKHGCVPAAVFERHSALDPSNFTICK